MSEKYVIIHANGIAMDKADTRFTALAVENGRIVTVGDKTAVAPLIDAGWSVLDLKGATVLPGFMDTHQHLGLTGQVLNGVDFLAATSIAEVYQRLGKAAAGKKDEEWVLGYTFNELSLKVPSMPLKEEIDAICTDLPVMLVHSSWHLCALNSKALDILNLPPDLPGLDLGKDGLPTGLVRDPGALTHVFPKISAFTPEDVKLASFKAACHAAQKEGITTLHCLEGGEYGPDDTKMIAENRNALPQHIVLWNQVMDIEETKSLGLPRIGGCICADGAIDAYTAALFEPYCNQPDNCGTLNFTQEEMDAFIMDAHKEGLQVAIHCETDAAIEQVLSALEKALAAHPRADHRHRIEHCEIPTEGQLDRMAKAGIIASMQPAFLPYLIDMDDYEKIFGGDRLRWLHPYRTMLDKGIVVCGGSDCPVTPHSPLTGIQAAVLHPNEDERISVLEAIRMFTADAAFSNFEEAERGSIEEGKYADLAVLAQDPTKVAPEAIRDIKIIKTIVEGKPVDDARDGPTSPHACDKERTKSKIQALETIS